MSSRFPDIDARAAWNEGARAWQSFVRSGADYYRTLVHGPALLSSCLPLAAQRVLDLGCGEGYFSRELAWRGARVVGVAVSEALLEYAQRRELEEPLGIEYRHLRGVDAARRAWRDFWCVTFASPGRPNRRSASIRNWTIAAVYRTS